MSIMSRNICGAIVLLIDLGFSCSFISGVVLVILKLTDNLAWEWLWVLSPFWGLLIATPLIMLGYLFYIYFVGINRL